MTELSPAAQAVLAAATQAEYRLDPADVPNEAARMASVIAPALRAVADRMKMPEDLGLYSNAYWAGALACETKLRSIADELENVSQDLDVADRQDTTEEEVEVAPAQSPELWRIMNRAAAFSSPGATTLEQVARNMAAAQLRAVADWLVPEEQWLATEETCYAHFSERRRLRHVLLAEADRAEDRP